MPRPRRLALAATVAVALLVGAAGGFGVASLRDPVSVTGYHRCPANSACFFTEKDGNGEMCSWTAASTDWTTGCAWADERPVRSVFNNADEFDPFHALAYYQRPGYQHRKGCTSVHSQGNLAGTYRVQSHQWLTSCAREAPG